MAPVVLTPEQQRVVDFLRAPPEPSGILVVDGHAGSGKTTLLRELVRVLGSAERGGRVTLCAPTGKACARLAEVVGAPAHTVHQLAMKPTHIEEGARGIFDAISKRDGKMVFDSAEKSIHDERAPGPKILVVDEASMVDPALYRELVKFAGVSDDERHETRGSCWLVFVGDSFQMPPVAATNFSVFELGKEIGRHYFKLSKVHRQAAGSPVLEAATTLITDFAAGKQAPRDALVGLPQIGLWEACATMDVGFEKYGVENFATLTYKNEARQQITAMYRRHRGYANETIVPGEPLVATQNSRDLGIYNGDILTFDGWADDAITNAADGHSYRAAKCSLLRDKSNGSGGRQFEAVLLLRGGLTFEKTNELRQQLRRYTETKGRALLQAEYGVVLTAHKAQGSEWKHVLVFYDEIFNQKNEGRYRWAYTAITRSSLSCTLCFLPRNALSEASFQKPKPMAPEVAALFGLSPTAT